MVQIFSHTCFDDSKIVSVDYNKKLVKVKLVWWLSFNFQCHNNRKKFFLEVLSFKFKPTISNLLIILRSI